MSTVISVENVSKAYRLGLIGGGTLHEDLTRWWARVRGRPDPFLKIGQKDHGNRDGETVWALRDVSFEVKQGEVLGIIGRNGAGKSTLLKILSQVTAPTTGQIKVKGRIGSLLEVGTGFHPELTGRENIFLNGAILGMTKREIERKLDEIIAFAEVERYIDTPVKRYSSGMYVRLAFAVAAHLDPEILIVDEVLAVGDAAFQKKCLGKMGDVARGGRTVLFVSHNMAAVSALCSRGLVLDAGHVTLDASTDEAIRHYTDLRSELTVIALDQRLDRSGDGRIRFTAAWVEDANGNRAHTVASGQDICIAASYRAHGDAVRGSLVIAFALKGPLGERISNLRADVAGFSWAQPPRAGEVRCRIPRLPLQPGRYAFNAYAEINGCLADWVQDAGTLDVEAGDFFGTGRLPSRHTGALLIDQEWTLRSGAASAVCSNDSVRKASLT